MLQLHPAPSPELNSFTVRWPVLIFFSVGMLVFLSFLLASVWWLAEQIRSDLLEENIQEVGTRITRMLDQERLNLHEQMLIVARIKPLKEAFLAGDREKLLAESQPVMKSFQEQQISRWTFYRPDMSTFLRVHQPTLFGDKTSDKTVTNASKSGKFVLGLDAGPTGMPSFQGVLPWQENGENVGYLAMEQDAVHMVNRLQEGAGVQLFAFFIKKFLEKDVFLDACNQLNFQVNWDAQPDWVLVTSQRGSIPGEVQEYLQSEKWQAETLQHSAHVSSQSDRKHMMFSMPLLNSDHGEVMRIVALWENHSLQHLFQNQSFMLAKVVTVIAILLGWLFYHYLGKMEGRIQKAAIHLRETEKSLTKAQQVAQIGNWEWRPDLASLTCSEQVRRIIGWDDAATMTFPDTLFARIPAEEQAHVRNALNRFLSGNRPRLDLEFRLLRAEGEPQYVHLRADAVREMPFTTSPALFGTLQDVSKLKKLELLAEKNSAFLQYALESMVDGILLTDEKSKIIYYNARFLSMWHISRELVGRGREKNVLEYIQPQLQNPEVFLNQMKMLFSSKEVAVDLLLLKDGRYVERHTYPIMGGAELLGREWRFVDVSVQYLANQREERAAQFRNAISTLLETGLQPFDLSQQLHVALEIILAVPSLSVSPRGSIFLLDENGSGDLLMAAQIGLPPELLTTCARIPPGHCLCGRTALGREILFAPHLDEQHDIRIEGMPPHGHYCVPILSYDALLGVINLYVADGHQRDGQDDDFLKMVANLLAGLIKNRRGEERKRVAS